MLYFFPILTQKYSFRLTGLFLYPLKTSKNQQFSDAFRGYRKRTVALNELIDLYEMG